MSISVTYSGHHASSHRPYSFISVHAPTGSGKMDFFALMDTGADYLTLDSAVASQLGIATTGPNAFPITVTPAVGGSATLRLVTGVEVTIEGNRVPVDAVFGGIGTPLIGRTAMVSAIEFGIDSNRWLYG